MRQRHTFLAIAACLAVLAGSARVLAEATEPPSLSLPFPVESYDEVSLTTQPGGVSAIPGRVEGVALPPEQEREAQRNGYYHNPYHAATYVDDEGHEKPGAYWALDLDAPPKTPIVAGCRGKITHVDREGDYTSVVVDIGDGYSVEYAEFDVKPALEPGAVVAPNDPLGTMRSGKGSHLHFEPQFRGTAYKEYAALGDILLDGRKLRKYRLRRAEDDTPVVTPVAPLVTTINRKGSSRRSETDAEGTDE